LPLTPRTMRFEDALPSAGLSVVPCQPNVPVYG